MTVQCCCYVITIVHTAAETSNIADRQRHVKWNESVDNQLKRRTKHGWQYGLSFSSLNVPLLSWHWQNEQTKCSGWNLRYIAVIQRPVTGLWHPAHSDPRWAWKCVSQYGRPSCSKKLPFPNGTRHSCTHRSSQTHFLQRQLNDGSIKH